MADPPDRGRASSCSSDERRESLPRSLQRPRAGGDGASPSCTATATELLQAAAREALDGPLSADDALSTSAPQHAVDASGPAPPLSPSLRSLQTERPPAVPDEQDRKRFVGCLAAVLAVTYDYEELDVVPDEELSQAEIAAYLAASAEDDEDDENDVEGFSIGGAEASLYSSSTDSFRRMERDRNIRAATNASKNQHYTQHYHHHHPSKNRNKVQEARLRHRKRRYDVMSKLLLSSAELLQLEKGQVKAFLPILSKLLLPKQPRSNWKASPDSWSRYRSGNEGLWTDGTRPNHRTLLHSQSMGAISYPSTPAIRRIDSANPKLVYSAAVHTFTDAGSNDFYTHQLDRIEHLRPFLESLTPGAGFRCLTMFLLQHLLTSQEGYDARIRHALKTLGVMVLVHDMENDPLDVMVNSDSTDTFAPVKPNSRGRSASTRTSCRSRLDLVEVATRKFEALEVAIATQLILLSREQQGFSHGAAAESRRRSRREQSGFRQTAGPTREDIVRGLKVGGTALLAGTLFAVTGGLAAPGIAAGVGMLMGGTAITAAATSVLTSTAAVTAIFGVGGGGLAAYKMHRRTEGLTEFEFRKETCQAPSDRRSASIVEGDLFSTIAISGWLRDKYDFQRPWGLTPSNPRLRDRMELLERFYSLFRPDHVPKCQKILQSWEGEEKELWKLLKQKYGRDPDHLFPLGGGPRTRGSLTLDQEEIIGQLLFELGLVEVESNSKPDLHQMTPFERMRRSWTRRAQEHTVQLPPKHQTMSDLRHDGRFPFKAGDVSSELPPFIETMSIPGSSTDEGVVKDRPMHLATVWSYVDTYGGELYTIKWESDLLMELCDSVNDLALDVVTGSTAQVLKHTALATLMSAIAWPYALVSAANMIDGTWTLAVERADMAGKELARSLLFSKAGHRPVTLVGYSFGARVIYACLKELAVYQANWEEYRDNEQHATFEVEPNGNEHFYKKLREPASIVEDAILLGLPNHLSLSSWKSCRQVVAGRLVNCFSSKDLILSLMFQFKRLGLKPVCGTCPVNVEGVENIDVTDVVSGHQDYCYVTGAILKRVRLSQPFASRPTRLFVPEIDKGRDF